MDKSRLILTALVNRTNNIDNIIISFVLFCFVLFCVYEIKAVLQRSTAKHGVLRSYIRIRIKSAVYLKPKEKIEFSLPMYEIRVLTI